MATGSPGISESEAVGSIEVLKQLKEIETNGAARLAALKEENEHSLRRQREATEADLLAAVRAAETEAGRFLQATRDAAEVSAREITETGEREVAEVKSVSTADVRAKQSGIVRVVLGDFLPSDP